MFRHVHTVDNKSHSGTISTSEIKLNVTFTLSSKRMANGKTMNFIKLADLKKLT
jgi:hypothetical protein